MTNPLFPKTLPLLVALAMSTLPLDALADPVCALGGVSQRSAITELCPFKDGMARIQTGYQWGFVDSAGKLAIVPQFDDVADFSEGYAAAQRDEKWGLIDKQGKWVVEPILESIGPFSNGLAEAQRDGKSGFIDATGKWVIPAIYEHVSDFSGAVAVASESYERVVLIDRSGRVVKRFAPGTRLEHYASKTGMFVASVESGARLVNVDGRKLPLPERAINGVYQDQHFVATKQVKRGDESVELYGLMDMAGTWVIAPAFKELEPFHGKLAVARPDVAGAAEPAGFGLIDKNGAFVVQPLYERISRLEDGSFQGVRAAAKDKRDFLDPNGKLRFTLDCGDMSSNAQVGVLLVLSACEKTWLVHAQNGLLATFAGEREVKAVGDHVLVEHDKSEQDDRALSFEIYNAAGKRVGASDPAHKLYGQGYDHVGLLAPGPDARDATLALPVAIYGKYSEGVTLLTRDYKLVTRPDWQYDSVLLDYTISNEESALEGPLVMKGPDGFGAVDAKGNWVIPPAFSALGSFRHGVAFATVDGKRVMVDSTGKTYPFPQNGYRFERTGYMVVTGENDDGPVSFDLRTGVLTALPEKSHKAAGGLVPTEIDGKWGLTNEKMVPVTAPVFDAEPAPLMHGKKLIGWLTQTKLTGDLSNAYLYGLLDPQGRELIKPRYSELKLDDKSGMLIATEDDHLQSVLSPAGKTVIEAIHGKLTWLGDGWFKAEIASLHGLVDQRGEWLATPGRFEFKLDNRYHTKLERPYAMGRKGAQRQLIDIHGAVSTRAAPLELKVDEPPEWWWSDDEGEGDTVFYGFNFKERARLAGKASHDGFSEGVVVFTPSDNKHRGKIGRADDKGKTIGLYDYASIGPMVGGMAMVSTESALKTKEGQPRTRYGYIDRSGKLAVPMVFDHAADFSGQRATVIANGGLALIDTSGKVLLRGAWQCGRTAVVLDSAKEVLWPQEAKAVTKCSR